MAYRTGKRYLLRAAFIGALGGLVGYFNTTTDRLFFTVSIAFVGILVGLVLGVIFDVLSIKSVDTARRAGLRL
jgi:ABC-type phosphate/phosphonate transport system permease subunit